MEGVLLDLHLPWRSGELSAEELSAWIRAASLPGQLKEKGPGEQQLLQEAEPAALRRGTRPRAMGP